MQGHIFNSGSDACNKNVMEIKIQNEADGVNDLQLLGTHDVVFSCFAMAPGIKALFLLVRAIWNLTGREKLIIRSYLSNSANIFNVRPLCHSLK